MPCLFWKKILKVNSFMRKFNPCYNNIKILAGLSLVCNIQHTIYFILGVVIQHPLHIHPIFACLIRWMRSCLEKLVISWPRNQQEKHLGAYAVLALLVPKENGSYHLYIFVVNLAIRSQSNINFQFDDQMTILKNCMNCSSFPRLI